MKLIIFIQFLVFIGCGTNVNHTELNYNCVILESTMESDKPIPFLIFRDTFMYVKKNTDQAIINGLKFDGDTIYVQENRDKFIFILNKEIINQIGEIVNGFSDTFTLEKTHPIFAISLISNKQKVVRFVNTQNQLKNLFDNLEIILRKTNLSEAIERVNSIRGQIW